MNEQTKRNNSRNLIIGLSLHSRCDNIRSFVLLWFVVCCACVRVCSFVQKQQAKICITSHFYAEDYYFDVYHLLCFHIFICKASNSAWDANLLLKDVSLREIGKAPYAPNEKRACRTKWSMENWCTNKRAPQWHSVCAQKVMVGYYF